MDGRGRPNRQHRGSWPPKGRNSRDKLNISDRTGLPNNNNNQGWAEENIATPNPFYPPKASPQEWSQVSVSTQVRSNTKISSYVNDNMRDYNQVASAPLNDPNDPNEGYVTDPRTTDVGGRKSRSGIDVSNTSRIIAERKRPTTGGSMEMPQQPGISRRRASSKADCQAMGDYTRKPRPTGNTETQPNNMRRVNTATGNLQTMEGQRRTETMQPNNMRRVNTAGDFQTMERQRRISNAEMIQPNRTIHDEFNDGAPVFNGYNPVSGSTRRRVTSASNRSNEQQFPSGVGGRRRSSRASSGRSSCESGINPQSGSASDVDECDQCRPSGVGLATDDFQQQLHQLRVNHRQQQQHRRTSSMNSSGTSLDFEENALAVMSAPLGDRLSNYAQDMNNPNQQMGALLREMQQLETQTQTRGSEMSKSEHTWYLGTDASGVSSKELGPLGISHHSKAYSAIGSTAPSDRTNDPRLFNDLLEGFPSEKGKLRWHEKHSLSKRTICIAVGLIVIVVAILGVVLNLSERDNGLGGNESVSKNSTTPAAAVNYVLPPPSDIDGRCSSSNLPGSLPACLEACYPAACCYNENGEKCLNANDSGSIKACKRYRPYCDIFHDTWDGATDGVLRTPQVNIVPICQQINGKDEEQFSKLRGRGLLYRNLMVGTAQDICDQNCEAAKCCAKGTVIHPYSAGLELSASGVYTDATTKEYVVTNCQDNLVYQKNKNLCTEYEKFCKWEGGDKSQKNDAWTSRPTMDPASTAIPSTSPSYIPSTSPSIYRQPSHVPSINAFSQIGVTERPTSMRPSASLPPTQKFRPSSRPSLSSMPTIPQANISSVDAACAGADNIVLLANENEAARTKCIDACMNGLCCYTEQLGYSSFIESCYIGNEAVCEGYSTCLWLQQSGGLNLDTANETNDAIIMNTDFTLLNASIVFNETTATNTNFTSLNTSIVFEGTSTPALTSSTSNEYSNSTVSGDESYQENIALVAISTNETITNSTTVVSAVPNAVIIPPPPSDLAALCALGQGRFCEGVCNDASCCFEEAPELNCAIINEEICQGYAPCSVLYQQGSL